MRTKRRPIAIINRHHVSCSDSVIAATPADGVFGSDTAEVTARVAVTGPANQPNFVISSDPTLPQDEVLSRLLFKKTSGGLSPFQALQLAQAVAQFSGGQAVSTFSSRRERASASTASTSRRGPTADRRSAPRAT
jgi:hypothetical protein